MTFRTASPLALRSSMVGLSFTAIGLGGCGDSAGSDDSDQARAQSAVVAAILTRTDDTAQTYLFASEHVPNGEIELSNALELPDALVTQNDEAIFVGDNERLVMQRYEVNADYSLNMTGEFSLQGYGVDYINNAPLFFSSTSAYYIDAPRGQLIAFNPSTMEITGDLQVPELLREGYVTWVGPSQRSGDRYLAAVLYTDENWTATAPDSTVGIIIEDDSEQPITMIRDDRGVGAYLSMLDDRGDFYFAADGLSGNLAITGAQDVPTSRILRVREGADAVDSSFMLDLGELLDTPGTFGFWPVSEAKFVVQAWASEIEPSSVLEPGDDAWFVPYYDWMFVDAATGEARPVQGLERSAAYNTLRLEVDGQNYLQRVLSDQSGAELYALHDDASAEKVAETVAGEFWFLGRVKRVSE